MDPTPPNYLLGECSPENPAGATPTVGIPRALAHEGQPSAENEEDRRDSEDSPDTLEASFGPKKEGKPQR